MADNQRMYYFLFNQVTEVIEKLQQIQQIAEECYLQDETPPLATWKRKDQPE